MGISKELMWNDIAADEFSGAEVKALIARVKDISPLEMAEALCLLESHKKYSAFHCFSATSVCDQTQVYFSRGLKNEIEEIYLELARHLRGNSEGSADLMKVLFDFFSATLLSLIQVPQVICPN